MTDAETLINFINIKYKDVLLKKHSDLMCEINTPNNNPENNKTAILAGNNQKDNKDINELLKNKNNALDKINLTFLFEFMTFYSQKKMTILSFFTNEFKFLLFSY